MERNHIHLAMGLPGSKGVISGMRCAYNPAPILAEAEFADRNARQF
jgi:hypothetical protein